MSYSEIMIVNAEGDVEGALELRNSHGTASMVWTALCRKYKDLMYDRFAVPPFEMAMWEDLWRATQDGRVALRWWEHNVLNWTYDNALIKGEDLETFVASLRMFEEAHALSKFVCHLQATADFLDGLLKDGKRPRATGLYATSVSGDPWQVREGDDDYRRYNIDRDTKHWFVEIRQPGRPEPARNESDGEGSGETTKNT